MTEAAGGRDPACEAVERMVAARTGVDIAAHMAGRVRVRIDAWARERGETGSQAFLDALERGDRRAADLLDDILAAVLVHETFFYRFRSQLDALAATILPSLLAGRTAPLRIWSAGCSRGPEPYTLGMIALQAVERAGIPVAVDVLGTDVCRQFLDIARTGVYAADRLAELRPDLRSRFLRRTTDGRYEVTPELARVVRFARHNLLDEPPERGFDVIACRNVLIYLGPEPRRTALRHLADALAPEGRLLVGHTETARDLPEWYRPEQGIALGVYRRRAAAEEGPRAGRPIPTGARRSPKPAAAPAPPRRRRSSIPLPPAPAAPGADLLRLEGVYDADRSPDRIASLKTRLDDAIRTARNVTVDADPADSLDASTGRLLARAARVLAADGRGLFVRTRRPAVRRWAERHGLPVEPGGEDPEVCNP